MTAKKRPQGIVYSTNPDFEYSFERKDEPETPSNSEQDLRVHLVSLKGNKKATVVKGFSGSQEDLKELGKKLKSACGTGGSAKDGEIIIQGDKREQVIGLLLADGYRAKRSGG